MKGRLKVSEALTRLRFLVMHGALAEDPPALCCTPFEVALARIANLLRASVRRHGATIGPLVVNG